MYKTNNSTFCNASSVVLKFRFFTNTVVPLAFSGPSPSSSCLSSTVCLLCIKNPGNVCFTDYQNFLVFYVFSRCVPPYISHKVRAALRGVVFALFCTENGQTFLILIWNQVTFSRELGVCMFVCSIKESLV